MEKKHGYYKGILELNGFKTPFIVYASSDKHAAQKAVDDAAFAFEDGAVVAHIEGPYPSIQL